MSKKSQPSVQEEIWTCRDGRKIAVGDMTEDHVRNTLRMLIRKMRRRREMREGLEEALDNLVAEAYVGNRDFDGYDHSGDNYYGDHGDGDDHWRTRP